jgi:PleD family two-component response regulator
MRVLPPSQNLYRDFALSSLDDRPIVLVIHGSPTVRHALFVTLDLNGFDVRAVGDAAEAVLWLADDRPRAMIVERSVGVSGQDSVLQQLRSEDTTNDTPLILLSRHAGAASVGERRMSGVHQVALEDGIDQLLDVLHEIVQPCGRT